jgi:radical SAM superfamily enzyme YgiQ (UPF0313 family)
VALVFAPSLLASPLEALAESMWPPMGILYLASHLRHRMPGTTIKVIDGCRVGYQRTWDEIAAFQPDILGVSCYTPTAGGAAALSRQAKQSVPGITVVMGGPHVSALPAQTLRVSNADLVVVGEGEETFCQIVQHKQESIPISQTYTLPGIWAIETDGTEQRIHCNEPNHFVRPLDSLPFPAWDLVNLADYRGWFLSKQRPEATILSARGCPYNCTFCSNTVWKSSRPLLRLRSAKNVCDEVEYLCRAHGIREFFDQADEFNNSVKNALAICQELRSRHLGVTWKCQLRVKPFTDELAQAMARAGCWYVHLGIESGNQETIDGVKKHLRLSDVQDTCRLLKKYGIKVLGLLMLYNVWEENGQLRFEDSYLSRKTLDFASSLLDRHLIDYISWSVATPYPGSELYDIALRHNLIDARLLSNWESWQKRELFILSLPGVNRKEQNLVKLKGEWLRARCMLRNGQFKLKDLPFLLKRGLHVLLTSRSK